MSRKFIFINGNYYPLDIVRKIIMTEDYTVVYFKNGKSTKFKYICLNNFHQIGTKVLG